MTEGNLGDTTRLDGLPDEVRSAAVVLSNGEAMWARQDTAAAVRAIAATGARILGLDLRSDGPGSTPSRGVSTEIPWVDCGEAGTDESLQVALTALRSIGTESPAYRWVLVTWK